MQAPFDERAQFLIELARRLHTAGVSASRLEGAVISTARALRVTCEIWSAPTGVLLTLGDQDALATTQQTRVLRLEPGAINLAALAALNRIADRVMSGELTLADASTQLNAIERAAGPRARLKTVLGFALASASVAALLRPGVVDVIVAAVLGALIGTLDNAARPRPHLKAAFEVVAAFVATVFAAAFAQFVTPLSVQAVVVSALIVLMPGLTLTTSIEELATQQLVTGTTRFAGAVMVLLKLTFGSIAGAQLVAVFGWVPFPSMQPQLPAAIEVVATLGAAFSFALLFHTARRDYALVMASAILGYVITRLTTPWFSMEQGTTFAGAVFFASLVIAMLANVYGRTAKRPGALVRVPGIMLLVPGSVGFRGLALMMERDYALGLETGIAVLSALLALTAGLLFGSLLVPPRRYL